MPPPQPAQLHQPPPAPTPIETASSNPVPPTSVPVNPSPLKLSTATVERPETSSNEATPTTAKSSGGLMSALKLRKSTRELSKTKKEAEKVAAGKLATQQAIAAREEASRKAAEREELRKKEAVEVQAKEEARKAEVAKREETQRKELAAQEEVKRQEAAAAEIKRKEQVARDEAKQREMAAEAEARRKEQAEKDEARRKEQAEKDQARRKDLEVQEEHRRKEASAREAARQKEIAGRQALKRKEAAEKEAAKAKEKARRKESKPGGIFKRSGLSFSRSSSQEPSSSTSSPSRIPPPQTAVPPVPAIKQAAVMPPPPPANPTQPFPRSEQVPMQIPSDLNSTPPHQTATSLPLNVLSQNPTAASIHPQTPPPPQRTAAHRIQEPPRNSRTSMFGTLKKRFSLFGAIDANGKSSNSGIPTSPKLPSTPNKASVSSSKLASASSPNVVIPTTPNMSGTATPSQSGPQRLTPSRNASGSPMRPPPPPPAPAKDLPAPPTESVVVIPAESSVQNQQGQFSTQGSAGPSDAMAMGGSPSVPEPLTDLPLRTTSHTPPRPDIPRFTPNQHDNSIDFSSPTSRNRSTSQSGAPILSSPLTKSISHDSPARSIHSQSDLSRRRSSVRGPRPMPHGASPESNRSSMDANAFAHSEPLPSMPRFVNSNSLPDGASPPMHSLPLPLGPLAPVIRANRSSDSHQHGPGSDLVTPSTSGDSSDFSNVPTHSSGQTNATSSADLGSPFSDDHDHDNEQIVIVDGAGTGMEGSNMANLEVRHAAKGGEFKGPEREGSNETIRADLAPPRFIAVQ